MFDWPVIIVGATLFVAYANGANDNFKGVATLFGSGTTDYRKALGWAMITTLAGSVAALFLATKLISIFQGVCRYRRPMCPAARSSASVSPTAERSGR
jgi:hypothetical protein